MQMDGRRRSNRIKKKNEVRSNKEKPKAEGKRKEKRNRKVRGQMRSEEDANMAARTLIESEESVAAAWLESVKTKQKERDARKIDWECPHCYAVISNSTFKITNGTNKGLTLREKHLKLCGHYVPDEKEDIVSEVSSTEERVIEGKRLEDIKYKNRIKKCPFSGCRKVYKGDAVLYFKQHLKKCSFKNQKELGSWVIRTSRKYDFDLQG